MSPEKKESSGPTKRAVEFLIYQNGKVLLEKRTSLNKSYSGRIIIPAGKVEFTKGETFYEACIREVGEECGIIPKKIVYLGSFENITPSFNHYLVQAYLIRELDGKVQNREGKSEHLWVTFDEAEKLLNFANSKLVLLWAKRVIRGEVQKTD